jgi:hypothetical protein
MKTFKTILLVAGIATLPLALSAADLLKPEAYYPIDGRLRTLMSYEIGKLDKPEAPLTVEQKSELRVILEKEAVALGAIQKNNLGDLTAILREGLPVICETNAKILKTLTPAQRAGGNALVVERREGFLNTIHLALDNLFTRYEDAAGVTKLMAAGAAKAP